MKITAPFILILSLVVLAFSCSKDEYLYVGPTIRPVYISYDDLDDIENLNPQPVENTGLTDTVGNLVFKVEVNKGIHVIDISNVSNPSNVTFIKIPGVTVFTIDDDEMSADNGVNMVTLDISNVSDIEILDRDKNVLEPILAPNLQYSGFFECVDTSKGFVIDWEDTPSAEPKCITLI